MQAFITRERLASERRQCRTRAGRAPGIWGGCRERQSTAASVGKITCQWCAISPCQQEAAVLVFPAAVWLMVMLDQYAQPARSPGPPRLWRPDRSACAGCRGPCGSSGRAARRPEPPACCRVPGSCTHRFATPDLRHRLRPHHQRDTYAGRWVIAASIRAIRSLICTKSSFLAACSLCTVLR